MLHGNRTYLMQDADGQIMHTHSVSAGLDYPGVGPEHAWLKDVGRVNYVVATTTRPWRPFTYADPGIEGIMPALESSHALAYAERAGGGYDPGAAASCWSTCRVAATRIFTPSPRSTASEF